MEDLKPGRELDALIAEKVMGTKYWFGHCGDRDCPDKTKDSGGFVYKCMKCGIKDAQMHCPLYSTSIEAAFEVVEKIRGKSKCGFNVVWNQTKPEYKDYWSAAFWDDTKHGFNYCGESYDSAPHAIALAALKVVESEVADLGGGLVLEKLSKVMRDDD